VTYQQPFINWSSPFSQGKVFALDLYIAGLARWENPEECQKLLERLTASYQPVGAAEELEVQPIAVCWWKRSRAWRYENAEIAVQVYVRCVEPSRCDTLLREHQARLALLKKAELEIEATGKLSEELKGKIFADAECARLWKFAEEQLSLGFSPGYASNSSHDKGGPEFRSRFR
jgi:predicted metal-binding protein